MFGKVSIDRRLQVDNRAEDAAGGRGEVKGPTRMARQPGQHLRMLVGGVVVEDDVDRLVGGKLALESVEKADEFDMAVALACSGR